MITKIWDYPFGSFHCEISSISQTQLTEIGVSYDGLYIILRKKWSVGFFTAAEILRPEKYDCDSVINSWHFTDIRIQA